MPPWPRGRVCVLYKPYLCNFACVSNGDRHGDLDGAGVPQTLTGILGLTSCLCKGCELNEAIMFSRPTLANVDEAHRCCSGLMQARSDTSPLALIVRCKCGT